MKLYSSLLTVALLASSAMASSDLIKKATDMGLAPIPNTNLEVLKLINDPKDPITDEKVELGKMLYFDPRLSRSGIISCNTCHNLATGGVDNVPAAIGHKWAANPHHLNSPTVFNSVLNQVQFWDGRSPHLADQAQGPMQAMPEMASAPESIVQKITSIPEYVQRFAKAYPNQKITFTKIADVIGVFERTLITPSKFDDFLNGDENALNKEEKAGLNLFIDKGCASCHTTIALGGTMQPFQVASQYEFMSVGDFKGDKDGMVKAPTLRNVELTYPYFHNGAIWNLADAVKAMGSVQLGIKISDKEASSIVTFLKSLTGRMPEVTYPILPPSTSKTLKPQMD